MSEIKNPNIFARLSIQRSLLGKISAEIRAVVFSIKENLLVINFYYDGSASDVVSELASCAETEIIADYEEDYVVNVCCIRLDAPLPIRDGGTWVYQRYEIS